MKFWRRGIETIDSNKVIPLHSRKGLLVNSLRKKYSGDDQRHLMPRYERAILRCALIRTSLRCLRNLASKLSAEALSAIFSMRVELTAAAQICRD